MKPSRRTGSRSNPSSRLSRSRSSSPFPSTTSKHRYSSSTFSSPSVPSYTVGSSSPSPPMDTIATKSLAISTGRLYSLWFLFGIVSSFYLLLFVNVPSAFSSSSSSATPVDYYRSLISSFETSVSSLPVHPSIQLVNPPEILYIALNLYENEDILPQMCQQLLYFIEKIYDPPKIYLSIFENGSRDHTPFILQEFKQVLVKKRIRHTIITHNVSWRHYCTEIGFDDESVALCLNNETSSYVQHSSVSTSGCTSLRDCPERIRIPLMAEFRNIALFPLFNVQSGKELREKLRLHESRSFSTSSSSSSSSSSVAPSASILPTDLSHLGFPSSVPVTSTKILFLNDILLQATDMVNLLNTENGNYDMVCSIDYELLKIYDTWVVRDIHGKKWSDWYPYTTDRYDTEQIIQKKPFRVFSCWNGAVVVQTDILLGLPPQERNKNHHEQETSSSSSSSSSSLSPRPVIFRSWYTNESRSVAVEYRKQHTRRQSSSSLSSEPDTIDDASPTVYSDACPVSECALFCTDLWLQRRNKIYINPNVGVYYNVKTLYYQRIFMELLVHPWLRWYRQSLWWWYGTEQRPFFSSLSTPLTVDDKEVMDSLWDIPPPTDIECGNNNPPP